MFGDIERETKECFFVCVPNRKRKTLKHEILKHIKPDTIIYSDQWGPYARVSKLKDPTTG